MILYFVLLVLKQVNDVVVKLVDKLIEEFTGNIDEVKIAEMALFDHDNKCVFFLHNLHYLGCNGLNNQHWNWCLFWLQIHESLYLKKDAIRVKFVTRTQTTI